MKELIPSKNIILQKIKTKYFGSFPSLELSFKSSLTIILGITGTGKTFILDAISFLEDYRKMAKRKYGLFYDNHDFYPTIEYYLNSEFFDLRAENNSIIVKINPEKVEIKERDKRYDEYHSRRIFELINNKLEIFYWNEKLLNDYSDPSLSRGERIYQIFEKNSHGLQNKLILIDDFHFVFDDKKKRSFYEKVQTLAEKNQVILASQKPIDFFDNKYHKILSPGQKLLSEYFVEIIASKTGFYQEFIDGIKNIEKLMYLNINDKELESALYKMLFVSVITCMETYLSDVFNNKVLNNHNCIEKLLKNLPKFNQKKYKLAEAYDWIKKLEDNITNSLLEISFHNIYIVKDMYEKVLDIEFPKNIDIISQAVYTRHDIVHRNGKTKDGKEIKIKKNHLEKIIEEIKKLINHIEDKIKTIS